ncbi:hypothetical protein RND81_12G241800 [Saponaria officinalis]|uniref:Secreted protein n=1 Tax=Saponaria officinalis TaxID=3572 RepID=A0AAW1HEW9_SAPOF
MRVCNMVCNMVLLLLLNAFCRYYSSIARVTSLFSTHLLSSYVQPLNPLLFPLLSKPPLSQTQPLQYIIISDHYIRLNEIFKSN